MKSSKSSLFLLELIIAILLFSIASAACIQFFAKAHILDIKTGEQNQTIIWSQNLAELWRAGFGDLRFVHEQLKEDYFFPDESVVWEPVASDDGSGSFTIFFDKNWNFTTDDAVYFIILETDGKPDENALLHAKISIYKNSETVTLLYELPLLLHIAEKGGQ